MELDNTQPIWLQLLTEFSRRIVVGQWPVGGRIPGVRELATEIGVNPNTVQRALSELEREGLCRSVRTSGRYVTEDSALIERARVELAKTAAQDFIAVAQGLQMNVAQTVSLVEENWKEINTDE